MQRTDPLASGSVLVTPLIKKASNHVCVSPVGRSVDCKHASHVSGTHVCVLFVCARVRVRVDISIGMSYVHYFHKLGVES
jgi:hypothetical protein